MSVREMQSRTLTSLPVPSHSPTESPVPIWTTYPSSSPTSSFPTSCPSTSSPSTLFPTSSPSTFFPSSWPTQSPVTSFPTTSYPSSSPTSSLPTTHPSTSSPSTSHPTSQPTRSPTSSKPTSIPSSHPTSSRPTSWPTGSPTLFFGCPGGTYLVRPASLGNCTACPTGSFSLENDNHCTKCSPGSYSPIAASTECTLCPLNTYQPMPGADSCIACGSGFVTGLVGSTASSDCVNPTASFAFGFFIILISISFMWGYIFKGRLQRIAFLRKERLIKKVIIVATAASKASDLVSAVSKVIQVVYKENSKEGLLPFHYKHMLKNALFGFVSILLITSTVFLSIALGSAQILFNAMVLYRSYRFYFEIPLSFEEQMHLVVDHVANILSLPFIRDLAYPFIYAGRILSDIHINLNTVQVSCAGAQAPALLLINFMIVGLVIIIIRSDAQVYWEVAQRKVLTKGVSMVFNKYYVSRNKTSTFLYFVASIVILLLPSPCKIIQYSMGFVTAGTFFSTNGHSPSDENCDASFPFPLDTFLAIITTVLVYISLPPMIYTLSQAIVPAFKLRKNDKLFPVFNALVQCITWPFRCKKTAIESGTVEAIELRSWETSKTKPDAAIVEERTTHQEISNPLPVELSASGSNLPSHRIDSISTTTNSIRIPSKTDDKKRGFWCCCCHYFFTALVSRPLKRLSSLVAVDWLYIKIISSIVVSMFENYRAFLLKDHFKYLVDQDIVANIDKYQADHERVQTVRLEMRALTLPHIPWFLAISDVNSKLFGDMTAEEKLQERFNEKLQWKKEKHRFPNFTSAALKVRKEMEYYINQYFILREKNRAQSSLCVALAIQCFDSCLMCLVRLLTVPASYIVFFQWTTNIGRAIWRRVIQNYLSVFTLAAGCWMEFAVEDFNLLQDYQVFSKLVASVEQQMEDERNRFSTSVRLTMIEEGEKIEKLLSTRMEKDNKMHLQDSVRDYDESNLWSDNEEENNEEEAVTITNADEADFEDPGTATTSIIHPEPPSAPSKPDTKSRLYFRPKGEALVKVINDSSFAFQHFVASIVSVRVVLLQIVPMLTLFSIIAVDISSCPILIFSKKMNENLPPLLVTKPFHAAYQMLLEDAKVVGKSKVPRWKVFCLGLYIFVHHSRLLQFLFLPINSITAITIVFSPKQIHLLYVMMCLIVFEFILFGVAYAVYMVLLLHRWMFPSADLSSDDDTKGDCDGAPVTNNRDKHIISQINPIVSQSNGDIH